MTVEQVSPYEVLLHRVPNKAGFTLVPGAGHCDLLKLGAVRFREIVSRLLAI